MAGSRTLAVLTALVAVGLAVAVVVFNVLAGDHGDPTGEGVVAAAAILTPAVVGIVLAWRVPGNAIGPILLAQAVILGLFFVARPYAEYTLVEDPGALFGGSLAAHYDEASWPTLFAGLALVAFVFPDGRFLSPRWRRIALATMACFAGSVAVQMLSPDPLPTPFADVENPLPTLPDAVSAWAQGPLFLGMLAGMVAGAWAVRVRLRGSTGVERLQLRWLAWAAALVPLAVIVCTTEIAVLGDAGAITVVAFVSVEIAIPLAVGIAVMRHRLYEIDRVVNRTLVYVVLTALLAGAYAAVVLVLGVAAGSGSAWTTAAATLTVALAFRPLRARVQAGVDRRFDRARYEGLRRVDRFLADLREGRAAPEEVERVIGAALRDPTLELRLRLPDTDGYVTLEGAEAPVAVGPGRVVTPVERAGQPLALIVHDARVAEHADLLESVVSAAGLAIEIAQLRVELRRRLAEVEDSRARIVLAGYEERRRLERDLHDGAQQRLVTLGLALRHVQHELPGSQTALGDALDDAVAQLAGAIDELRELAQGVRPARLDDGLAAALRELAERSPVTVKVEATTDRFPEEIEAAAYFVACEALTNAAKHAGATVVKVDAARRDGNLVVRVADDGAGGATPAGGSGLAGLLDRVEAHGGSLRLSSEPGAGTVVVAELPCAS